MANGDRAAAVGMDTVAGTDDIRQGYDEINKSRDYLADHRTDGTHPASAITSGVLPTVRGGTGRGDLFDAATDENANPVSDGQRLLVVDNDDNVYALRNGTLDARYLGFEMHAGILTDVTFDAVGAASEPHGCPFTPDVVITQAAANAEFGAVSVQPRNTDPSWTATHLLMTAKRVSDGTPHVGTVQSIRYIAWRAV